MDLHLTTDKSGSMSILESEPQCHTGDQQPPSETAIVDDKASENETTLRTEDRSGSMSEHGSGIGSSFVDDAGRINSESSLLKALDTSDSIDLSSARETSLSFTQEVAGSPDIHGCARSVGEPWSQELVAPAVRSTPITAIKRVLSSKLLGSFRSSK